MKKLLLFLSLSVFTANFTSQEVPPCDGFGDTFSICAIDLVTGEVGSAGASCIAGSIILSDVHPNRGIIHTQAYYLAANQNYARTLMNMGLSPQQIIDSVVLHDAQNNPSIRQYGVVDNVSGGRFASYTGVNCTNWKGHTNGLVFSIQGNILLGQQIIDSMRSRFLNTPGTLATRLMAALQGAKVPGADTRCIGRGTSSISAFLRVARTTDPPSGPYYLDLNVNNTPPTRDPIDSLQVLYNLWLTTGVSNYSHEIPNSFALEQNYPNPFNPVTIIKFDIAKLSNVKLAVYDLLGKQISLVEQANFHAGKYSVGFDGSNLASGTYIYQLTAVPFDKTLGVFIDTKKMILVK